MAQYLLTYLQRTGDDYLRWCVCDDKGAVVGQADHGTFEQAAKAAQRRRVVMVVAGTELLMEEADVPGANQAKAHKAIPYMLEEQLAQDVDASHFAFGNKQTNGRIPVAVISKQSFAWIREMAEVAKLNIQEIIPETMALPFFSDRWTVMTNNGHASVRLSSSKGFSCDTEMLPMLLGNAVEGASPEQIDEEILRVKHFSCGRDEYRLLPEVNAEFVRTEVALFAQGLSQYKKTSDKINLLQGDYGKTEALGKAWKPWRLPAALAAMLLALWGGTSFLHFQQLGKEDSRLRGEMAGTLKRAFPNVQNPERDPLRQMRANLRANAGTGIDDTSFVVMMSAVGVALKQLKEPTVNSINFKRGQLDIVLEAESLQDVDKLKSSLEKENQLVANVQSAAKERDRIKARLRVETSS